MENSNDFRIDMDDRQDSPVSKQKYQRKQWVAVLLQVPLGLLLGAEYAILGYLYFGQVKKDHLFDMQLDKEKKEFASTFIKNYFLETSAFVGVWGIGTCCFREGLIMLFGWAVSAFAFVEDILEVTNVVVHLCVTRPFNYFLGTETPFQFYETDGVFWLSLIKIILQILWLVVVFLYYDSTRSSKPNENKSDKTFQSDAGFSVGQEKDSLRPRSRLDDSPYKKFLQELQEKTKARRSTSCSTAIQIEAPHEDERQGQSNNGKATTASRAE